MKGLFLLIAGGLTYGAFWFLRQKKLLQESCFTLSFAKPEKISVDEVIIILTAKIKNKSDIDLSISNQYYEIYINGNMLSEPVKVKENISLPANSETKAEIEVSFNPKNVLGIAISSVLNIRNATLGVKGYLSIVSSSVIINKLPIDYEAKLGNLLDEKGEEC